MRFPTLWSDLQWNAAERDAHLNALIKLRQDENADQKLLFDYLYAALNILDTKSGNLMRFNSFLFTISSLLISLKLDNLPAVNEFVTWRGASILLAGLFSFISGTILLGIIWVHWSETTDIDDPHRHRHLLLRIRNSRTLRYRIAWILSLLSLFVLSLHLGLVAYQPVLAINNPR